MKISAGILMNLAKMICGDEPFSSFPYRSSSYLTEFFIGLNLDYIHDGSTRRVWVNDVLKELNNKEPLQNNMPSLEIVKVIESLLHPEYFLLAEGADQEKSIEIVNQHLRTCELTVVTQSNGTVKLCPAHGNFISTSQGVVPNEQLISFKPSIFNIPNSPQNEKLISVMMPFDYRFSDTYSAIKRVVDHMQLECKRADDIWNNSTIIQDIFDLIFCAKVVIVDFTGRNPNVMYETGIAHALGKIVIPITQSLNDIPSDIIHHRALHYLPNEQGYNDLSNELYKRLNAIYQVKNK